MGVDRRFAEELFEKMPRLKCNSQKSPMRVAGFPTNTGNKCAKFINQGCWQDASCSELSAFVCGISFPVQPSTPSTVIYSTTTTTVIQPTTTTNGIRPYINLLYSR